MLDQNNILGSVMNKSKALLVGLIWAGVCAAQTTETAVSSVSEKDFLGDMPIVLSVSRLPQRLDDTPGAVTVLDRNMIRLSGAREVADLMRLVPGFQTSMAYQAAGPQASYHGGFGNYSNRLQVLVDGRSVYSPYSVGSVEWGLQSVAMEDIERIEVLRGSNSAAYGARAFLGVINIVTRDSADTQGVQLSVTRGDTGIHDVRAGLGWGSGNSSYRLGVDRRSDDGLMGTNGHNTTDRLNFRGDLRLPGGDELQLRAGALSIDAGKGRPNMVGDPLRDTRLLSNHLQVDWRRSLAMDQDLALSYVHMRESYHDVFPYSLIPLGINDSISVDASGAADSDTLTLQHTWRSGLSMRLVSGFELRRERVTSRPAFNTNKVLVTDFSRLFANLEWRPASDWLLNAGAMAEHTSTSGSNLAPRLMLNWHFAPDQTLRIGSSRAFRPPSTFEQFADVRHLWNGHLMELTVLASGNVRPESVLAHELGYMGNFPALGLNLDVRAFREQVSDFMRQLNATKPRDYANTEAFFIQGLEYQLKWQPWQGAQVLFNQAYIRNSLPDLGPTTDSGRTLAAPRLASTLSYFQKMTGGWNFSLMHQDSSTVTLQGAGRDDQTAMTRTDLRVAAPVKLAGRAGELALTVQNLGSPYADFEPAFKFQRRAFVTLRIDN